MSDRPALMTTTDDPTMSHSSLDEVISLYIQAV